MRRKPKPATAGEKIAWECKGNDSLVYLRTGRGVVVTEAREVSRRIDRAIAHAVRNEKERCGEWINHYASTNMQLSELRCAIAGDEHP